MSPTRAAPVRLAFGYDTERPYGALGRGPAGARIRHAELRCVARLTELFARASAPLTFFVVGDFLEQCARTVPVADLRAAFRPDAPGVEIQQHGHAHQLVRPLPERPDKRVLSVFELAEDLRHAREVLREVLGVVANGLRTPLGHARDLADRRDVLAVLRDVGIDYVSSWCRGAEVPLHPPLSLGRQPRDYGDVGFPDLVEVPASGWQDVIFTREHARKELGRDPDPPAAARRHYVGLLDRAAALAQARGAPVSVCLCLHPFAVTEWDPDLGQHAALLDEARRRGAEVVSYGQIADRV